MPLYDFICLECREKQEVLIKFNERDIFVCPKCGGKGKFLMPSGIAIFDSDIESDLNPEGKDIQKRYIRTDGSVGRTYDKFYESTMKDYQKGIFPPKKLPHKKKKVRVIGEKKPLPKDKNPIIIREVN